MVILFSMEMDCRVSIDDLEGMGSATERSSSRERRWAKV